MIGAQTLHSVGYAMGIHRDQASEVLDVSDQAVVLTCFGDGATSEGEVHEAFVWAAVMGAPVVFFCQNNQWAISEPLSRQTRVPLFRRAVGYGFPGVQVDGNDVLAVHAVTRQALARARSGAGPTLIEAVTYRMGAHTTSDDPTRYRDPGDDEFWRERDPISRVRSLLLEQGGATEADLDSLAEQAKAEAARVRAGCLALPDPEPMSIFDDIYVDAHAQVDEERAWFAGYLAGGEDHV